MEEWRSFSNEGHTESTDAPLKRESWIERWKKRRRFLGERLSEDEKAQESRARRMGRALMRLVGATSAERPVTPETQSVVEKAKRVGRWAVFLVTGVRAEVWQATVHEPPAQRQQEVKPLVSAEGNLTAALHELDAAARPKPATETAEENAPLAKVYEFPAPRHLERQASPAVEPDTWSEQNEGALVAPHYETAPTYEYGGIISAASASAVTVAEAMRRISHVERPPRAGVALPAAVAVAVGLGISRNHWRREVQVLRRENARHEQRLQTREVTLRHLQAERPNLREVAARQAYVGEVASFANREAAEIREIAHEVRAEARPVQHTHYEQQASSEQPITGPAPQPERLRRIDAHESHKRLTTRTPEVTQAVHEFSSTEKAEATGSHETTEQELASRIEQLDRDDQPADARQTALLASQAANHTTSARELQAAQQNAHQLRQQRQIQTVSYVILVITAMAMLLAAIVWL